MEDMYGASQPYKCPRYRAQKNGARRSMKTHGHLYGAHYLKRQFPAKSSSTVAASPCASPKDASATKLICLALHFAYVMENVKESSVWKYVDSLKRDMYIVIELVALLSYIIVSISISS